MGDNFFHTYTLHTCFRIHSPYSYLVYTLQAHVTFKSFEFSQVNFFHTNTLHTCFRIHSPYSYLVYTLQAHVRFKIFKFSREIIFSCLLSTHVSGFTLHTVIWFTLSKHMLRLKVSNFHRSSFFSYLHSPHVSGFTLHTIIWLTLSKHMLGSKFSNFHGRSFLHTYTLHTCFRVHSPYSYLVYILKAHVRFNIFKFSQDFIFFILTLSTHVSEFTLHAVVFTLSKQMLHFKILYSYYNFIMCLNAPLNHECLTP